MKSTDKLVLVLVASLALLLAGCGGGGSSTAPVDPGPTPAESAIKQAETALMNAENTLEMLGASATDAQREAAYRAVQQAADNLVTALKANNGSPAAVEAATTSRQNAMNMANTLAQKIEDDAMAADAAMMETAAKLYAGISRPFGGASTSGDVRIRAADYNTDGDFRVNAGLPANAPAAVILSQDKEAVVAAHRGWEGMKFTASPTGAGTYEAVVYSNVGEPTPGDPFNEQYSDLDATTGERPIATSTPAVQALVASSNFDQSAGTKEFELGTNLQRVIISGSFHGVSGNYYCTPAASSTCAVQVAADGFTLGGTLDATNAFTEGASGGAWTFKPNDANARVTEMPDTSYVSYGWWIHTSADGSEFRVSAFRSFKGSVLNAANVNDLNGTATYVGGAAGKYALSSPIGGTNDAGHFTARATLEANFTTNTATNAVTGTIDNFIGADGEARDWTVELKGSPIGNTGTMSDAIVNGTVWTIGGTAAAASGEWDGRLYDNGDDGVPKVAVGKFYSTYGPDGKMVGGFGVNLEE